MIRKMTISVGASAALSIRIDQSHERFDERSPKTPTKDLVMPFPRKKSSLVLFVKLSVCALFYMLEKSFNLHDLTSLIYYLFSFLHYSTNWQEDRYRYNFSYGISL